MTDEQDAGRRDGGGDGPRRGSGDGGDGGDGPAKGSGDGPGRGSGKGSDDAAPAPPLAPEDADNDNPHPTRPLPDSGGEPRRIRDQLDPWRAAALHAALDRPGPAPRLGDALAPLHHRLYFAEAAPGAALAPDGTPAPGGFWPDTGLPFRMRGGGRIDLLAPLRLGEEALCVSVVQNVALRQGRGDPVAVVTLRHEISGPEGLAVRDEEDLVFRAPPSTEAPRPDPPLRDDRPAFQRTATADPVLLFRYAALTYDANRVHYDRAFAAEAGHDGLPAPAMLLAQQLVDLLGEHTSRRVARLEYRSIAPVLDGEAATLCGRTLGDRAELWALRPDGRLALEARATLG